MEREAGRARLVVVAVIALAVVAAGVYLVISTRRSGSHAAAGDDRDWQSPATTTATAQPDRGTRPGERRRRRARPPAADAGVPHTPPRAADELRPLGGRARPRPTGPLSAGERAERLDQAAHFRAHLNALRERVATLEKDLERLRREGGTREQINQIELQIQAARAAEPRMKGHLERIEKELGER